MTFLEKYQKEETWHGRVMIMEVYHLAMTIKNSGWTLANTAEYFDCSIGLVSENLRLARLIHDNDSVLKCETRQDALKNLGRGR